MWKVVESPLSDASMVYAVSNGKYEFHCEDEKNAEELLAAIEKCSVDDDTVAQFIRTQLGIAS